jgi:hypothetical protein
MEHRKSWKDTKPENLWNTERAGKTLSQNTYGTQKELERH